jgi:hypothetical protein
MPFGPIAPAMALKLVHMASQGHSSADADTRAWCGRTQPDAAADDFWPEVSSQYSRKHPVPVKPENSPQRVLFEVFLVLAAAGLAVAAVVIWGPAL